MMPASLAVLLQLADCVDTVSYQRSEWLSTTRVIVFILVNLLIAITDEEWAYHPTTWIRHNHSFSTILEWGQSNSCPMHDGHQRYYRLNHPNQWDCPDAACFDGSSFSRSQVVFFKAQSSSEAASCFSHNGMTLWQHRHILQDYVVSVGRAKCQKRCIHEQIWCLQHLISMREYVEFINARYSI